MYDVELNLNSVERIIECVQSKVEYLEDRKRKSRSKFDKQCMTNRIEEHINVLKTVKSLKTKIEQRVLDDHRNYNYSIQTFMGTNKR